MYALSLSLFLALEASAQGRRVQWTRGRCMCICIYGRTFHWAQERQAVLHCFDAEIARVKNFRGWFAFVLFFSRPRYLYVVYMYNIHTCLCYVWKIWLSMICLCKCRDFDFFGKKINATELYIIHTHAQVRCNVVRWANECGLAQKFTARRRNELARCGHRKSDYLQPTRNYITPNRKKPE